MGDGTAGIELSVGTHVTESPRPSASSVEKTLFENYREQALTVLEEKGFLERQEGKIFCDLDKFRESLDFDHLRDNLGPLGSSPEYGDRIATKALYYIFKGLKVYSKADYGNSKAKAKPLFYIPKNEKTALSPLEAKKADFHLGFWEIKAQSFFDVHPMETKRGRGPEAHQTFATCLIYNKDFGNAFWDEQSGKLRITYPNGSRRPISSEFFREWKYWGKPNTKVDPANDPTSFFARYTVEGVNPFTDFRPRNPTGVYFGEHRLRPRGLVMIGQARYNLGTEHGRNPNVRVRQISNEYAAVMLREPNNSVKLTHFLKLAKDIPLEASITPGATEKKYPDIGIKETRLLTIEQIKTENPLLAAIADNYDRYLGCSQRFSQESGINLGLLTLKEQVDTLAIFSRFQDNRHFWEFISKYRLNGLRSMMALEDCLFDPEKIWELSRYEAFASSLFQETAAIVEKVLDYENNARGFLHGGDLVKADNVAKIIKQNAGQLLLSAYEPITKKTRDYDTFDVVSALRNLNRSVSFVYAEHYRQSNRHDEQYQRLLDLANSADPNQRALAKNMLNQAWEYQISTEKKAALRKRVDAQEECDRFYQRYGQQLYEQANETTGDTEQQLAQLKTFFKGRKIELAVDLGCGDAQRITRHIAEMIKGKVVGVDRLPPRKDLGIDNLKFLKGDFGSIPLPESSVDVATAIWSPINDFIPRSLQIGGFNEISRVLKVGGEFFFDVPFLEGGEGSWKEAAGEYHRLHPDEPQGMIVATFPGDNSKRFYIYPEKELKALLSTRGFETVEEIEWRTKNGRPRKTYLAKLVEKVTPQRLEEAALPLVD